MASESVPSKTNVETRRRVRSRSKSDFIASCDLVENPARAAGRLIAATTSIARARALRQAQGSIALDAEPALQVDPHSLKATAVARFEWPDGNVFLLLPIPDLSIRKLLRLDRRSLRQRVADRPWYHPAWNFTARVFNL